MSIKKELLDELTKKQLEEIAEEKGIKFNLSEAQKEYYRDWDKKDKLVDLMSEKKDLSLKEIEEYIKLRK